MGDNRDREAGLLCGSTDAYKQQNPPGDQTHCRFYWENWNNQAVREVLNVLHWQNAAGLTAASEPSSPPLHTR